MRRKGCARAAGGARRGRVSRGAVAIPLGLFCAALTALLDSPGRLVLLFRGPSSVFGLPSSPRAVSAAWPALRSGCAALPRRFMAPWQWRLCSAAAAFFALAVACGASVELRPSALTLDLASNDTAVQLRAAVTLRNLLTKDSPLIADVVDSGAVPFLVRLLLRDDNARLQYEAAWSLTNIATGSTKDAAAVVASGGVPALAALLICSPSTDVQYQVSWAIGNLAGDTDRSIRDSLLDHGVMLSMTAMLDRVRSNSTVRQIMVWTISNLCRGLPKPNFEATRPALPLLATLLREFDDENTLIDSAWALSYLADGPDDDIAAVAASGVVPLLVPLLAHESQAVVTPALRTLGNFAASSNAVTQLVLDSGVLPFLRRLLQEPSTNASVLQLARWIVSDIAAGTDSQLTALFDESIIPALLPHLNSSNMAVLKKAAWSISNALHTCSEQQVTFLVCHCCAGRELCTRLTLRPGGAWRIRPACGRAVCACSCGWRRWTAHPHPGRLRSCHSPSAGVFGVPDPPRPFCRGQGQGFDEPRR